MGNWTPEQQKEHRKLWVEALRSGKYRQATGILREGDRFCCLGVACDISGLGEWDKSWYEPSSGIGEDTTLPPMVCDWLGLANQGGGFGDKRSLWAENDEGMSFTEIADIIESEPEGLISSPEAA